MDGHPSSGQPPKRVASQAHTLGKAVLLITADVDPGNIAAVVLRSTPRVFGGGNGNATWASEIAPDQRAEATGRAKRRAAHNTREETESSAGNASDVGQASWCRADCQQHHHRQQQQQPQQQHNITATPHQNNKRTTASLAMSSRSWSVVHQLKLPTNT